MLLSPMGRVRAGVGALVCGVGLCVSAVVVEGSGLASLMGEWSTGGAWAVEELR